jgi:membrane-bound lytic murein transglycosylase B
LALSPRIRLGKRSNAALLSLPILVAATGSTAIAAQASTSNAPKPVADVHPLEPATPLAPFGATPYTFPLNVAAGPGSTTAAAAAARRHHHVGPPASARLRTLPHHLNVNASTIPRRVLESYVNATKLEAKSDPACHLQWQTLAGIGFIESDHARSGGSEKPHWDGVAKPPILGPLLDGRNGVGRIRDTDHGQLDGNATWDRAVGPMQFIPSTWVRYAADGNHDGIENPQDIDDATLAAADYLCATGSDLNKPAPLIRAIHAYNHSYPYVRAVLTVTAHYMNINPAKLGINGLPKGHKHHAMPRFTVSAPPPAPTRHAAPKPKPTPTPTPTPRPTKSPSPSPSPSPSQTASPSPAPGRVSSPSPSPRPTRP